MDPIKEAMKESYKGHGLSKLKKLETQQKVREQRKTMLPVVISTVVTFTIFLFIFLTINEQDPELKMSSSISSKVEGQDAVIEMMERKLQFQTIIEDGEVTAAERLEYLRKSDWKLQLAFEHITNSTYEIPDVTEDQGLLYATLLFYMRQFMLEPHSISEVAEAFSQVRVFQQLPELVPVLDAHILAKYQPTKDELMPANQQFFLVNRTLQVIIVCMYILSVFFIIKNIIKRQHLWITLSNIAVVIATFVILFKPLPHFYANDETTLLTSSIKAIKEAGLPTDQAQFISAATFDNSRFALIKEQQNHMLVRFQKGDNYYQFTDFTTLGEDTPVITGIFHVRNDGQAIYVMAFTEGHPIVKGVLIDHASKEIEFQVEQGKAGIEAVYLPQRNTSFGLKFYDANGEIVR